MEDYTAKKKAKIKNYQQTNIDKIQKRWQEYYRNLSEKIKEINYDNIKNKKKFQTQIEQEEKNT